MEQPEQLSIIKPIDDNINDGPEYQHKSFFILALYNPLRCAMIKFWFEHVSMMMILVNSITLGMVDPCDRRCEKPLCETLEIAEHVIFVFFFVEMLIKMMAKGVWGKGSYLDESWNRFDLFVIVVGLSEYVFADQDLNFSAIRALRVLRPLRAINRISSLRLLVTLILDILPMLGNVMIFCVFIFFVFGIVSVQLWSGILRQRCFFPNNSTQPFNNQSTSSTALKPPDFMPPYYHRSHDEYICSPVFGMRTCDQIVLYEKHDSMCIDLFANDGEKLELCQKWVGHYTECRADAENPTHGTTNFDNIGYASIAIFQVISLEGWAAVMYYVQDAFSFWVWIYFIVLLLLGSYFAVKLCLVVIAAQFTITRMREKEKMKQERLNAAKKHGKKYADMSDSPSIISFDDDDNDTLYHQILDLIAYGFRQLKHKVCRSKLKTQQLHGLALAARKGKCTIRLCEKCKATFTATAKEELICPKCEEKRRRIEQLKTDKTCRGRLRASIYYSRKWVRQNADNAKCQGITAVLIIANAAVMACEHYEQPSELTDFIEVSNIFFTAVFVCEILIRLYGFGAATFIREAFNVMDTMVIIINIAEMVSSQHGGGSGLSVLRLFRLLRLVKILRFFPALQKQLLLMLRTVDNVTTFFLLLAFLMYTSALLGMHLFGCKFCQENDQAALTNETLAKSNFTIVPLVWLNVSAMAQVNETLPDKSSEELIATSIVDDNRVTFSGDCRMKIMSYNYSLSSTIHGLKKIRHESGGNEHCAEANFDTVFHSVFTVLQIFTGDNWGAVMRDGMRYAGEWASVYFIILVAVGDYIIFNLLIGILVEGFSNKQEEELERQLNLTAPVNVDETQPQPRNSSIAFVKQIAMARRWRAHSLHVANGCGRDSSLFLFGRENPFRRFMQRLVDSAVWDTVFIIFTLASCGLIVLERPGIHADSLERYYLSIASYSISFIFLVEALCKIIAQGFIFSPKSYLRQGWNILDFGLLILAAFDLILELLHGNVANKAVIHALRPIRLLRALRPLRLISRAHGLRVVLQTLALSIKPIGHIILICCFFFAIFAILGVQLFGGCFSHCVPPKSFGHTTENGTIIANLTESEMEELIESVRTRAECLEKGLEWQHDSYNFNTIPNALMTLFVFATLDGWTEITRNGADCSGPDFTPVHDSNLWSYVYFIAFLLIVCFFALNMFVGVVVNNFQKVNERMAAELAITGKKLRTQALLKQIAGKLIPRNWQSKISWLTKRRVSIHSDQSTSEVQFWLHYPKWRFYLYSVMVHPTFELVIMSAVAINVLSMAAEFYRMPFWLSELINVTGDVFMILLTVEMFMKMVAFGLCRYLADKWNLLDLFVTASSLVGVFLENMSEDLLALNPSVIRIARVFRIVRIVKLWRAAKNLHALLDTVSAAIPQVINLSILFVLLFFIYASLGVQLYGRFDCDYEKCEGLSRHANFRHFGMALLTLFRIFTGDDWNVIQKEVMKMSTKDSEYCAIESIEQNNAGAGIPCSIVSAVTPFYFVSFVLLAQFVLINIVVAVLMQQIENLHKNAFEQEINATAADVETAQQLIEAVKQHVAATLTEDPNYTIPRIPGLNAEEVVSLVSVDYLIRQEIRDVIHLTSALVRLDDTRKRANSSFSTSSSMTLKNMPLTRSDNSVFFAETPPKVPVNTPRPLRISRSLTIPQRASCNANNIFSNGVNLFDKDVWLQTAIELQELMSENTRGKSVKEYVDERFDQLSRASSVLTWQLDDDLECDDQMFNSLISEKLDECATLQFETWDSNWK